METVTTTDANGVVTTYYPQSYTDAAVAAATAGPQVKEITDTGLVITHSDGTEQSFVPAPTA